MGISRLLGMKRGDGWALLGSCLAGYFIARSIPSASWAIQAYILVSYHLFLAYLLFARGKQNKHPIPIAGGIAVHLAFLALIVCLGIFHGYIPYFRLIRYAIAGLAVFERWFIFGPDNEQHSEEPIAIVPQPQLAVRTSSAVPAGDYALTSPAANAHSVPAAESGYVAPITGLRLYQDAPDEPQPATAPADSPVYRRDAAIVNSIQQKPRPGAPSLAPLVTASAQDHEEWLRYLARRNPTQRKLYNFIDDEYAHWMQTRMKARAAASQTAGTQGSGDS